MSLSPLINQQEPIFNQPNNWTIGECTTTADYVIIVTRVLVDYVNNSIPVTGV